MDTEKKLLLELAAERLPDWLIDDAREFWWNETGYADSYAQNRKSWRDLSLDEMRYWVMRANNEWKPSDPFILALTLIHSLEQRVMFRAYYNGEIPLRVLHSFYGHNFEECNLINAKGFVTELGEKFAAEALKQMQKMFSHERT